MDFSSKYEVNSGTGCWEWLGWLSENGYGRFEKNKKKLYGHRYSFSTHVRPLLDDEVVLHLCDNRKCVNPDHLRVGSHTDNHNDMCSKGRNAMGESHGMSKLNELDVMSIFNALGTQRSIADEYGISQTAVWSIKSGRSWHRVTGVEEWKSQRK